MGTGFETVTSEESLAAVEVAACTTNWVWMRTEDKLYYRTTLGFADEVGSAWVEDTSVPDYPMTSITCGKDG
jgi:hypothetical protein